MITELFWFVILRVGITTTLYQVKLKDFFYFLSFIYLKNSKTKTKSILLQNSNQSISHYLYSITTYRKSLKDIFLHRLVRATISSIKQDPNLNFDKNLLALISITIIVCNLSIYRVPISMWLKLIWSDLILKKINE